jgi:hypothetical protein
VLVFVGGSCSGTQSGTQAEAGLDNREATRLQAETQDCCWTAAMGYGDIG